jgi:hypothetical protein
MKNRENQEMTTKELYRLWRETGEEQYFQAYVDAKKKDPETIKMAKTLNEISKKSSETH